MDHLDKEVIESVSESAKRVFKSLDYRSKQRMLKKARERAKEKNKTAEKEPGSLIVEYQKNTLQTF